MGVKVVSKRNIEKVFFLIALFSSLVVVVLVVSTMRGLSSGKIATV